MEMVGDDISEFVFDVVISGFLKLELVTFGANRYQQVRFHDNISGLLPTHTFREHHTYFFNIKQ